VCDGNSPTWNWKPTPSHGEAAASWGLGGSGLLGALVVYGEVWSLSDPQAWRYAAGICGSVPDGLWTVEYGDASEAAGAPPRHQVAAQWVRRYGPDVALTVEGRLFADPDAYRGSVSFELTRAVGNLEYTASLLARLGPEPAQAVLGPACGCSSRSPATVSGGGVL